MANYEIVELMQRFIDNLQFSSKSVYTDALAYKEMKRKLGYAFVS